ncbi:MAG: succinate dehydrogenase/fumarate reductase iron-sulfur subunit [Anaerolineaceae bacterium]|nr:succinate dehydrogenase/fumarate reductase iron-sulfur subunit [Anaerolineaceae bacterium]
MVWTIELCIARQKAGSERHYQTYQIEIDPDEYVLDAVEKAWAFYDRSLTFRHACHHSTCGACGMLVNGVEKLTCITPIRSVVQDKGRLLIEPLRNFPILSDLVVDTSSMFNNLNKVSFNQVASLPAACLPYESEQPEHAHPEYERLVDCIECGMCISACPISLTSSDYIGPAVLAAAQHESIQSLSPRILEVVDNKNGVWRCHSAYECSAVCPSGVEPGWRIMKMRQAVIAHRIKSFFSSD